MVGLRAQTMRDAQGLQRQGKLGHWREMEEHPFLDVCWTQQSSSGKVECNSQHRIQPQKEGETANPMH